MNVDAIILAAGSGSRYHGNTHKLLEPVNGIPMVRLVAQKVLLSGFRAVALVYGANEENVKEAVLDLPLILARNEDWQNGQASSMVVGLRALPSDSDAACFVLSDQPYIQAATYAALRRFAENHPSHIIAPHYQGKRGNPCTFPACVYGELLRTTGDRGGRDVMKAHGMIPAEVDDPGILKDIDTLEDLKGNL